MPNHYKVLTFLELIRELVPWGPSLPEAEGELGPPRPAPPEAQHPCHVTGCCCAGVNWGERAVWSVGRDPWSILKEAVLRKTQRALNPPGGSVVKNPPAHNGDARDYGFGSPVGKIPWSRKWHSMPVFLPGKFHGQWCLAGYKRVGHDGASELLLLLLSRISRVRLCATPETAAHQAPPSLGFSRQEHWSGLSFPSPMHESEKWKWSRSVVSDS